MAGRYAPLESAAPPPADGGLLFMPRVDELVEVLCETKAFPD